MANQQSYPSPTAVQTRAGAGPFYGNGGVSPHDDGKDVSHEAIQQLQLSAEMEHINPDLQENSHHSHPDDYAAAQAHDHQALAQSVMSLQAHHPQVSYQIPVTSSHQSNALSAAAAAAAAAAAKQQRSKVSRACDECRRKKIRCDATTENETSSCTACKKSNQSCQFSRTPQKRGPSKGYIKELADRVSTLERERQALANDNNALQSTGPGLSQEDMAFLSGVENASLASTGEQGRRRSHSEAFNEQYPGSGRGGFPPDEFIPVDENAFNSYMSSIHMTLPILPRDVSILRDALADASPPTRDAFLAAFECTLKAVQSVENRNNQYTPKRAYELLVNSNWMDSANLLQLQALLLLLLESANRGSQVIHGGHGNSPWQYLNEAVLKGKGIEQFSAAFYPPPADPDTLYTISRSVLLSMTILDAFLALGNKKQGSSMDDSLVTVWDQDMNIVGQRCYMLSRMARILSRLAQTRVTDQDYELHRPRSMGSTSKLLRITPEKSDLIHRLKTTDIDLLQTREVPDDPILQMAFWYTRAQIEVTYWPLAVANNVIHPVRRIVEYLGQISHQSASSSPITHHFSGLAAHLLIQLCEFSNTKDEASALLTTLDDTLQILAVPGDTLSFDAGIRDIVRGKRIAMIGSSTSPTMGLEHLANAAVAGTDEQQSQHGHSTDAALQAAAEAAAKAAQAHMTSNASSFDGSLLSQEGYLTGLLVAHGG